MDDKTPTPDNSAKPGAPEIGNEPQPLSAPSAPLQDEAPAAPVFQPEPTKAAQEAAAVQEKPVPVDAPATVIDDEDDSGPEEPPKLDEHQAKIDHMSTLNATGHNKKRHKGLKIVGVVLLIIIALGALAGAGYLVYKGMQAPAADKSTKKVVVDRNPTTPTSQATDETTQNTADTEEFSSEEFGLTLNYPSEWTAAEQTGQVLITSPVIEIADASGKTVPARMVLEIRPKQSKPDEFKAGAVVAVLDSEKIQYSNPSATQRGSTYLSYLQYAGTDVKGGMDGVYVTGGFGYKYAQQVKLADISQVDPLIDVTFVKCSDDACEDKPPEALTISSTAWQDDEANRATVEDMLKSIRFN